MKALGGYATELSLPGDDLTKPMNHWIGGVHTIDNEAFQEAKRYKDIPLTSKVAIDLFWH